jgi:hypothetical protein
MHNMLIIKYLSIYGCVRMASEQVLMSRLRVLMSRPPVRVASRQVLMRYELTRSLSGAMQRRELGGDIVAEKFFG